MLHLPGLMMPGQFGPSSRVFGEVADERVEDLGLVLGRDALGDAHDEPDAGRGRLEDRRRRGLRRHGDERGGGAGRGDGLGDRVEDRDALRRSWPPLPGVTPADDLRAVGLVAQAVVLALPAGEALHDDLGVGVDEDGHVSCSPFAMATAARAASSMVGFEVSFDLGDAGVGAGSRDPPRRWCRRGG